MRFIGLLVCFRVVSDKKTPFLDEAWVWSCPRHLNLNVLQCARISAVFMRQEDPREVPQAGTVMLKFNRKSSSIVKEELRICCERGNKPLVPTEKEMLIAFVEDRDGCLKEIISFLLDR